VASGNLRIYILHGVLANKNVLKLTQFYAFNAAFNGKGGRIPEIPEDEQGYKLTNEALIYYISSSVPHEADNTFSLVLPGISQISQEASCIYLNISFQVILLGESLGTLMTSLSRRSPWNVARLTNSG